MKVALCGIELEGGWSRIPPAVATGGRRFVTDGSVRVSGSVHKGELTSAPIPPEAITAFVVDNYPDKAGPCCGLHIHMSFGDRVQNAATIAALAESEDFQRHLLSGLETWGRAANVTLDRFWSRLAGREQYCAATWRPDAWRGNSGRYYAVNFAAWSRHETLEVRVLPMFKSKSLAAKALCKVIELTDAYLAAVQPMTIELDVSALDSTGALVLETFESVVGED